MGDIQDVQHLFDQFNDVLVLNYESQDKLLKIIEAAPRGPNLKIDTSDPIVWDAYRTMIRSNMRLVLMRCLKYCPMKHQDIMELVSLGTLGLIRGLEKYDSSFNTRFSTFGVYWIDAFIRASLKKTSSRAHIHKSLHTKYRQAKSLLVEEGEEDITDDMVFSKLEWGSDTITQFIADQNRNFTSLGAYDDPDVIEAMDDSALQDFDDPINELSGGNTEIMEIVLANVEQLPEIERHVIKCIFGLDQEKSMSVQATANFLELTPKQVNDYKQKALYTLWKPLADKKEDTGVE